MVTHCYNQKTLSQFAELLYITAAITTVHCQMELQYGSTTAPLLHVGAFSTNHRAMDCMGTGETGEDLVRNTPSFHP